MRILCLVDYQCCYLSHSILTGLHETGHEIWELPILNSVRGGVDEGYDLPDGNRGYSATPGYLRRNPLPPYQHHEVTPEVVNSCDLIVMLSTRDYAMRGLKIITTMTGKEPYELPIVLCDGEDYEWINRDILNLVQPKVFFKRELANTYSLPSYSGAYGVPIFPLPFAAFTRSYPEVDDTQKTLDFYLSLGDTHELRRNLVRHLLDERIDNREFAQLRTWIACNSEDPTIKGRADAMSSWEEYIARQAQARVTAVVRGYGSDTLHCWEAFSFATGVIYFEPQIYIPYPFNNNHCWVQKEGDLEGVTRIIQSLNSTLVDDYPYTEAIAAEGKKHCRVHHTTKARAEYLLDVSMRVLGGRTPKYEEFGL